MGFKFNPLIYSGLDLVGGSSGGTPPVLPSVQDEASLPGSAVDGQAVVVRDTDHIYVYNGDTGLWRDTGLTEAQAFGTTPNDIGYDLDVVVEGGVERNVLTLQPADATHPGGISEGAQTLPGLKSFPAGVNLPSQIANRAAAIDASNNVVSATTTLAELNFVSGVTSAIQTQLDSKIPLSQKGAPNGVATLDGGGKIPATQLPNTVMELQGFWDAATNTPTLVNGVGNPGDVWEVDTAGTTDFGAGPITFAVGDWAVYAADNVWHKSLNSNAVTSVNGQVGTVVLDTDDINEGITNLYYTDERAQDAVGTILISTASIDLVYNDGTPSIIADVIPGGVDHNQLLNFVADEHIDHSAVEIVTDAGTSGLTGGGDITATRTLSVDIDGTTLETTADNADKLLIYDDSSGSLKSMTRAVLLSGVALASPGDIAEQIFTGADAQVVPADVTGLAFGAGVRSFRALVSVTVDATSDLYETFTLSGINRGSTWLLSSDSVGDTSLVTFDIDNTGQVTYQSGTYPGFVSLSIHYRAITTTV